MTDITELTKRMREAAEINYSKNLTVTNDEVITLCNALAQRDAQIAAAISEMECAANDIAYAVYNLADMKLPDLKPGIIESTGAAESALIAERNLRAMAAKLREGK